MQVSMKDFSDFSDSGFIKYNLLRLSTFNARESIWTHLLDQDGTNG